MTWGPKAYIIIAVLVVLIVIAYVINSLLNKVAVPIGNAINSAVSGIYKGVQTLDTDASKAGLAVHNYVINAWDNLTGQIPPPPD